MDLFLKPKEFIIYNYQRSQLKLIIYFKKQSLLLFHQKD
ncbi:hypothetical protein D1BOALGB6SA_1023 [Olavius sp. associated proteobacterium Delta 1]|nr:hypothetical protein D1BOALGB6SA_1023 [Olavius sp. associated proteobacterium Delta 1]